ncbi:MAG: M15 family metallopeptidase [Thainema sp.]
MKPYQTIPVQDCREPLVPLSAEQFALVQPHPYAKLGAPYGDRSPFFVRQGVCNRLQQAQAVLQQQYPNWRIQIFDAYRPVAVQKFMVYHTFHEIAAAQGLAVETMTETERQQVFEQVYEFWAAPNPDPACPPPHSTGAAVDVTVVDETGTAIAMGSPIDEPSPRSYPNHFANSQQSLEQTYHRNRQLLRRVMCEAGFCQHHNEWWHFSYGDQMWAWQQQQANPNVQLTARYGRIE